MPVYTCTLAQGTLSTEAKSDLAGEITTIHSTVNHVPGHYVNVVFNELPPTDVFTGGQPGRPLIINGWVRTGHPDEETSQLVRGIADAATRVTGVPAERVLVVIENSPAHHAIEAGRVLPEPGQEHTWLAAGGS
ncbi:tautomerase [Mycobacterium sp. ACS4331]|nr:tautomerase family protein [Mycobacterium sp. ACS4331]OBF12058.1 tautomerase [Mycobacterium sp. ACS4331]